MPKKCEGFMQPEFKKFSLDPQITSFEMLQHILASAFNIKGDFTLSYLAKDDEGQEIYLSMLSDWDMDAAFQSLDDWDIIAPVDVPQYKISNLMEKGAIMGALSGISNQVGKTVSTMQRVMGLKNEEENKYKPSKQPMTDMEFRNYLDSSGHLVKPEEFRLSIYQGGVESSLRRVVWRHLLNIFPEGMSGRERFDYMKKKENEYYELRDYWKNLINSGSVTEEIKCVTSMVKKDVLRTDRTHKLFSGGDDSKNLISLFHILVTYALTHPQISYCQGMSDIASPLLVIQKDEAQAYLCLCGIMKRVRTNFLLDGNAITTKFKHLSTLLQLHDPVLYAYLKDCNAHDLFFCYRWLLLELKREFPFDDALYMLEVMWSTLPPDYSDPELPLTDPDYYPALLSTSPCSPSFSIKQTVYAKLLALRVNAGSRAKEIPIKPDEVSDQPQAKEIASGSANNNSIVTQEMLTSDVQDYPEVDDPITKTLQERSESIDKSLKMAEFHSESVHCHDSKIDEKKPVISLQIPNARKCLDKKLQGNSPEVKTVENVCDLHPNGPLKSLDNERIPSRICPVHGNLTEINEDKEDLKKDEENGMEKIKNIESDVENSEKDTSEIICNGISKFEGTLRMSDESLDKSIELENNEIEQYDEDDNNDSGQSQFYISLDSTEEEQKEIQASLQNKKSTTKGSFFSNMKHLISSPKRQNSDKSLQRATSLTEERHSGVNSEQPQKDLHCSSSDTSLLKKNSVSHEINENDDSGMNLSDCVEVSDDGSLELIKADNNSIKLPPPEEFGCGNPFLMFVCLTLLLQHRDAILRNKLEYDEIAMLFDRMVRKHNVHKVFTLF
ncbi:hypothetical protein KUTeg_021084, partial [Tegillarca granosa]